MRCALKKVCAFAWLACAVVLLLAWPATAAYADTTIDVTGDDISSQGVYNAIQDALDEAADNASADDIYTVTVASGSYTLDNTLNVYSYTTLDVTGCSFTQSSGVQRNMVKIGDNQDTQEGYYYQDITIIGGTWSESGNSNTLIKFAHAANVTLQDATFSDCYNSHLMEVAGVDGLTITGCTFKNQTMDAGLDDLEETPEAIQLDILTSDHFSGYAYEDLALRDVTITDCTFKNVPRGVGNHTTVLNNPIDGLTISNNTFKKTGSAAIQLMNVKDCTISGNTMTNVRRGICIYSYRTSAKGVYSSTILEDEGGIASSTSNSYKTPTNSKIVISGNTIDIEAGGDKYGDYDTAGILLSGLELSSSKTTSARGTIPKGNYYLKGVTVSGNTITTTGQGVRLTDVRAATVSGNKLTNTKTSSTMYGVSAANASKNVSVTGNTIKKFYTGVYVNGSSTVTSISKNKISGSRRNGIMVQTSTATTIKSNTITNAKKNGIHIYSGAKVTNITSNTITSPTNYGIIVEKSTATNIKSNKVSKTGKYGIFIHSSCKVKTISGNTLTSCKTRALVVQSLKCNMTISNNTISKSSTGYVVFLDPGTKAYKITFKGNTVTGKSSKKLTGLRIDSGKIVVKSNKITSCKYPVVYKKAAKVTLSGNKFSNNTVNKASLA